MLQLGDAVGCPHVLFTTQAEGIVATDIQAVLVDRCIAVGITMPAYGFLGNLLQADTFNGSGGTGEPAVDEFCTEADGIEDLCATVGLVGRNAHL